MRFFSDIIVGMRPRQWTKNMIIFAALVFSKNLFVAGLFLKTLAGFGLFCLVSGSVYLFNDVIDVQSDKAHPSKRTRPVAAGRISKAQAVVVSACGAALGLSLLEAAVRVYREMATFGEAGVAESE